MVWPAIAAGIAVAGQLYSANESKEAAREADATARMSARFVREETEETVRRQGITDELERGRGVARVAAAGLRGSGTAGGIASRPKADDNRLPQVDRDGRRTAGSGDEPVAAVSLVRQVGAAQSGGLSRGDGCLRPAGFG